MSKAIQRSEVLVALQRAARTPLRIQLERGLRLAIQTGRLTPGALLPSTRVFSSELGVSRGLVVDAYEQLVAEGYLCSQPGSSTHVSNRSSKELPPDVKPEVLIVPRFDFRPGRPDHSLFPRRAWVSALRQAFADAPATAFDYADVRGAPPARTAL